MHSRKSILYVQIFDCFIVHLSRYWLLGLFCTTVATTANQNFARVGICLRTFSLLAWFIVRFDHCSWVGWSATPSFQKVPNIQPALMKKATWWPTSGGPSENTTGSSRSQSQTLKESQMPNLAAKKRPATVLKKSPAVKKPQVNKANPAAPPVPAPRQ